MKGGFPSQIEHILPSSPDQMEVSVRIRTLIFFLLLFSAIPSPAVTAADPQPAAALFVLGDSTTNCGDNTILYPLLPSNLTSCFNSRRRRIPDLIAERMGLPSPPLFYSGNLTAERIIHGINFGSTPATIISHDGGGGGRERMFLLQSLSQQVRHVQEALQMMHLEVGPESAGHVAQSSLFLLSFGTDDYIDLFTRGGPSAAGLKYGRHGLSRVFVSQMVQAVKDLYNADVRKIAYMGVGPLGCAPRIVLEGVDELQRKDCIEEVNDVVSSFNAKLANELLGLNAELPGIKIVFCDVYRGIAEILSNPSSYGFRDVRNACCGLGMLGATIGCLSPELSCIDPPSHVWWDFYGTTEGVNALVANWSWSPNGLQHQICHPFSLQQLVSAS